MPWSSRRTPPAACRPRAITQPLPRRWSRSPRRPGSKATTPWRSTPRAVPTIGSHPDTPSDGNVPRSSRRCARATRATVSTTPTIDRLEALADELSQAGDVRGELFARSLVAVAACGRGQLDRAERQSTLASDAARRARLLQARLASRHAAATVRLARGDLAGARRELRKALDTLEVDATPARCRRCRRSRRDPGRVRSRDWPAGWRRSRPSRCARWDGWSAPDSPVGYHARRFRRRRRPRQLTSPGCERLPVTFDAPSSPARPTGELPPATVRARTVDARRVAEGAIAGAAARRRAAAAERARRCARRRPSRLHRVVGRSADRGRRRPSSSHDLHSLGDPPRCCDARRTRRPAHCEGCRRRPTHLRSRQPGSGHSSRRWSRSTSRRTCSHSSSTAAHVVLVVPAELHALPWAAMPSLRDRSFALAPSVRWWIDAASRPQRAAAFGTGRRRPPAGGGSMPRHAASRHAIVERRC